STTGPGEEQPRISPGVSPGPRSARRDVRLAAPQVVGSPHCSRTDSMPRCLRDAEARKGSASNLPGRRFDSMKAEQREPLEQNSQPLRRVLVVDDHPSFRRCVRTLLSSEGYEVVGEAEDGESALKLTATLAPDVVLLDIQLPDINGFEVVSRLHEHN